MKYLILMLAFNCFAITKDQSKELFTQYLTSIQESKEEKFKSITSTKYYEDLKSEKHLEEMFKLNKKNKSKIDFDIKIKKAQNEKEVFFVNIKDKEVKNFDHNWFRVIKKDNKFIIDGSRFFD